MQVSQVHDYLNFASRIADDSRRIIQDAFRRGRQFDNKQDGSPVTEIDKQVERGLRQAIANTYPDHGILGEEYAPEHLEADYVWVIDPIDGTKDFITGIPTFGTLIALAYRGAPILGIIDLPMTQERFAGADGVPTTLNGTPVTVRKGVRLPDVLLSTSSPDYYKGGDREALDRLRPNVHWCVYGGGCCAYGRIAAGSIDVGLDTGFDPADYCAHVPIIRNAGGVMTDWEGNPLTIRSGKRILAAGDAKIHEAVLEILAPAARKSA